MLKIITNILGFLFPTKCVACKKEGSRFCYDCQKKYLKINLQQFCPVCHKPSFRGAVCNSCKNKTDLDSLIVVASYHDNEYLQKLLKQMKYYFAFDIVKDLGMVINGFLKNNEITLDNTEITYVPLHWRRLFNRGFNQSYLIARQISTTKKLLKRIKNTPQQAKLNRKDRLKNIKNSFLFVGKIVPQKVLLIDDVCSTMATLNECACILKKAGVRKVYAFVLARNTV